MSIILLLHIIMLTFTFGHVELLTVDYHSIDTPIVELNNHTLREVFDGAQILLNNNFDSTNNWSAVYSTQTNDGNITTIKGNGTSITILISQNTASIIGTQYYINARLRTLNDYTLELQVSTSQYSSGYATISSPIQNQWYNVSQITISTQSTHGNYVLARYTSNELALDSEHQVDYYYLINQTDLGITDLTVQEMDTYFQMYQDNISGNDVTYTQNEMSITDLTYIIGFGFIWFVIIWSIRKVVL